MSTFDSPTRDCQETRPVTCATATWRKRKCVSDGAGASGVVKRLLRSEKGCLLLSSERAGVNGERWQ